MNIIINAISVWNTVYLQQATEHRKKQGMLQEELLNHISPLGWEHINFLGAGNLITVGPGRAARTFRLRVRKNVKPVTLGGLAYIFVKMLAGPLYV